MPVHHSTHWPVALQGLKTEWLTAGDQRFCSYSPKKGATITTLTCFSMIASETTTNIKNTALSTLEQSGTTLATGFRLKPDTSIAHEFGKIKADFDEQKSSVGQLEQISGQSSEELQQSAVKAKTIVEDYFKTVGNPTFLYSASERAIEDWASKTTLELNNFAYSKCGIKRSDEPLQFTREDREAFGIEAGQAVPDPTQLSCLQYALLKARELKARDVIFSPWKDHYLRNLLSNLADWGFRKVAAPDEGDLVVYMSADGRPLHVGCYTESGKVSSKLGILNTHTHTHDLFNIPAGYGSRVVFFRKSNARLF
jgi:hypothetical protein